MSRKNNLIYPTTALYCRLSMEDGRDNESMSISNQKAMLKDYAEKNGMGEYSFYVDDGYTGRNFNRPGFQRMIADIEAGKVNCVITKDLSRLGRNYIEAGSYIEIYFPRHNVRYIAITDGVDSQNKQELDITPFRNILNDLYSRDISKKVLAGWMTRSRQGKFLGGTTPYGLIRDPKDHGHLIIDPKTAPIVKKIYDLASDGWGNMRISKYLLERKIPITRCRIKANPDINYYSWGGSVISMILRNPVYYGAHVVCKTHQKAIRSNTINAIPRDQWEIIENCHEAIVSKEQWERVQKLIDHRPPIMKGNACPFYNLFHGLLHGELSSEVQQIRRNDFSRSFPIQTFTRAVVETLHDKCHGFWGKFCKTGSSGEKLTNQSVRIFHSWLLPRRGWASVIIQRFKAALKFTVAVEFDPSIRRYRAERNLSAFKEELKAPHDFFPSDVAQDGQAAVSTFSVGHIQQISAFCLSEPDRVSFPVSKSLSA
nr:MULTISPECIES: recombinase family protein [Acutalibacteraceae]